MQQGLKFEAHNKEDSFSAVPYYPSHHTVYSYAKDSSSFYDGLFFFLYYQIFTSRSCL